MSEENPVEPAATADEARQSQLDQLIQEIKDTADKLQRDNASRGDVKILSRALKELRYAFKVFTPYRHHKKVTVFGSARTMPDAPAYQHAARFGEIMAENEWMVLTGAGGGIMEAAHVGAGHAMSMGVNIMLPFEQEANHIINDSDKLVHLKYFFTRKLLFVKEVHAIVLFAGGFGTQDEGFETLTLVQTGKRDMMPIVFVDEPGGTYWKSWKKFIEQELLGAKLISPDDMRLFKVTESVVEAAEEVLRFYRVYDSMRYIRNQLVLRIKKEPTKDFLHKINEEFADILVSGTITRVGAHKFESDEAHLADLPRLSMHFNRSSMGRLRILIDMINTDLADEE